MINIRDIILLYSDKEPSRVKFLSSSKFKNCAHILLTGIAKFNDYVLTLNLLNFLNGIINLPFLELSIIILGISRLKVEDGQPTVESGQTVLMCRLAWLYTDGTG